MRRAESSDGENVIKDAKRAAFCFNEAAEIYFANKQKKAVAKLMKRVDSAKRLQLKKRRRISLTGLSPKAVPLSTSSTSSSEDSVVSNHDETIVSELTWMENYSSEYYRKQHLLFLQKQEPRPSILRFFDGNLCSYFCHGPPVHDIEFVEKNLEL